MDASALLSLYGGESRHQCLLDSLLANAAGQPDAIAVADGDRELSYAQLLGYARGLACLIEDEGVVAGDRVAVIGPRGIETVAALLATSLCGATYVPLDIEYPVKRLSHMLLDSAAKLLLRTGPVPDLGVDVRTLAIPDPGAAVPVDPARVAGRSPVACRPELPVYVIYTSGSTGWPKGVAISHSCLDNMVQWQHSHSPRPDLRTAQFAPLNFDVSFQEILGTLCGGGSLLVVPERLRREPVQLLSWLAEHRVQRLFLPYVALQMLAVVGSAEPRLDHLSLVEVNVAGEQAICTPQIREFFGRLPGCRLVNHYGQSESAMVSSHILDGPSESWPALPPIGVPLPGCETLVDPVDPDDPTVGELLVAGLPVSLGFINEVALNATRFVATPPTPHGHTRVFRTGDLVRLSDGVLHFLGRLDSQTKVRGVRVNLLEIDVWLLKEPGVATAASALVETGPDARSLRAAVTRHPDAPPLDAPAILARLAEVLPAVSVPLSVTVLTELPRTPSGKIDRTAVADLIAARLRDRRATR
jgi:D-alanine--poly(phosphoribitol) ligase subunit 1